MLSPDQRALLADARTATLATLGADGRPRLVPICHVLAPHEPGGRPIVYTPLDEKPKRSRSRKKVVPITEDGVAAAPAESAPLPEPEPVAPEAVAAPAPEPVAEEATAPRVVEEPVAVVLTPPDPDRPKRGGWWNKLAGRK